MAALADSALANPWRTTDNEEYRLFRGRDDIAGSSTFAATAPDLSLQRPTTPGPQLPELQRQSSIRIDDDSLRAALSDEDAFTTPRASIEPAQRSPAQPPRSPPAPMGSGQSPHLNGAPRATMQTQYGTPGKRPSFMKYLGTLRSAAQGWASSPSLVQDTRPIATDELGQAPAPSQNGTARSTAPATKRSSSVGAFFSTLNNSNSPSNGGRGWFGPVYSPPLDSSPNLPSSSLTPRRPKSERQPASTPSLFHQRLTGTGWFGPVVSPDPDASRLPSSRPPPSIPFPASASSSSPSTPAEQRERSRLEWERAEAERQQALREGTTGASRSARRPGLMKRLSSGVSMKNFSLAALKSPLVTPAPTTPRTSAPPTPAAIVVEDSFGVGLGVGGQENGVIAEMGEERGERDEETWRPIDDGEVHGWSIETHHISDTPTPALILSATAPVQDVSASPIEDPAGNARTAPLLGAPLAEVPEEPSAPSSAQASAGNLVLEPSTSGFATAPSGDGPAHPTAEEAAAEPVDTLEEIAQSDAQEVQRDRPHDVQESGIAPSQDDALLAPEDSVSQVGQNAEESAPASNYAAANGTSSAAPPATAATTTKRSAFKKLTKASALKRVEVPKLFAGGDKGSEAEGRERGRGGYDARDDRLAEQTW